ncbi:MAG: 3,4-dihydroxy-2-butanone-4-phosphate synthase [Dongiaceae bacterium]
MIDTTTILSPNRPTVSRLASRVEASLEAMRSGLPVILFDDHDREDEADLVAAAETLDLDVMARLIRDCSGIVCLCLDDGLIQRLALPPMVERNSSRYGTAFTVSIEAVHGVTTGVSAADRLTTVRAAIADHATPGDLARPGHIFPLRAVPGGVLERPGHTEGTVDLARLAGLKPAGVLCELMRRDGSMMRGKAARDYGRRNGFPCLTIAELIEYRHKLEGHQAGQKGAARRAA